MATATRQGEKRTIGGMSIGLNVYGGLMRNIFHILSHLSICFLVDSCLGRYRIGPCWRKFVTRDRL